MPSDHSIILKYFPELSDKQAEQFALLGQVYEDWNQKINVVSRKDVDDLYLRHVLHSLAIAKFFPFGPGTSVLDMGTGGGFPGIPLAIFFPGCEFHLADSIGKKIQVANEVIGKLELQNTKAEQGRVEELPGQYDVAVCRAVAPLRTLLHWLDGRIKPDGINEFSNGLIALKGGDLKQEISEVEEEVNVHHLKEVFKEDFFAQKLVVHVPARSMILP